MAWRKPDWEPVSSHEGEGPFGFAEGGPIRDRAAGDFWWWMACHPLSERTTGMNTDQIERGKEVWESIREYVYANSGDPKLSALRVPVYADPKVDEGEPSCDDPPRVRLHPDDYAALRAYADWLAIAS